MATSQTSPGKVAFAAAAYEDEVRLRFGDADLEEGIPGNAQGIPGDDDGGDADEFPQVAPLRHSDNGEIDEAASRALRNIGGDEAATTLGRSGRGGRSRRGDNPESVEVHPGPNFTLTSSEIGDEDEDGDDGKDGNDDVDGSEGEDGNGNDHGADVSSEEGDAYADPVADAMMAKILISASSTQLGRLGGGKYGAGPSSPSYEAQSYTPGYEESLSTVAPGCSESYTLNPKP
jgi:hypothetical protein